MHASLDANPTVVLLDPWATDSCWICQGGVTHRIHEPADVWVAHEPVSSQEVDLTLLKDQF